MRLKKQNFETNSYFGKDGVMGKFLKQLKVKPAFTLVELLTVLSVIALLIGLLVPALNKVRLYARDVKQAAQLHAIVIALELYKNEMTEYPPSGRWDANDTTGAGTAYNGALKLTEAMVGRDLLGQHLNSFFEVHGMDTDGNQCYPLNPDAENRSSRTGPYLNLENANAYKLSKLYKYPGFTELTGDPWYELYALCDVYGKVENLGTGPRKIGMPILYYTANTVKTEHDVNTPNSGDNIYDYRDNYDLLMFGLPPVGDHNDHPQLGINVPPVINPTDPVGRRFYEQTKNENVETINVPYNADSFILLSAGGDGRYGTPDDIFNFEK